MINKIKKFILILLIGFCILGISIGLSINIYKDRYLEILSKTNYYKLNCLKPAVETDSDTFNRCKKIDKIINKDNVSFNWPKECDNFDPDLILALKKVESNINPKAIGDGGRSFGLMQIQYTTAKGLGFKGKAKDLLDPYTNMKYGCMYLSKMYEKSDRNVYMALMAYNAGPNALKRKYKGDWVNHPYVGKILLAKKK